MSVKPLTGVTRGSTGTARLILPSRPVPREPTYAASNTRPGRASYWTLVVHCCRCGVRSSGSMNVLLLAEKGDVAGNDEPSARIHRGVPLASRTIRTSSGMVNGLTFRRGYGSDMFSGDGTFW